MEEIVVDVIVEEMEADVVETVVEEEEVMVVVEVEVNKIANAHSTQSLSSQIAGLLKALVASTWPSDQYIMITILHSISSSY